MVEKISKPDFIIISHENDQDWADWIAWFLQDSGFTLLQHQLPKERNTDFAALLKDSFALVGRAVVLISPNLLDLIPARVLHEILPSSPNVFSILVHPVLSEPINVDVRLTDTDEEGAKERLSDLFSSYPAIEENDDSSDQIINAGMIASLADDTDDDVYPENSEEDVDGDDFFGDHEIADEEDLVQAIHDEGTPKKTMLAEDKGSEKERGTAETRETVANATEERPKKTRSKRSEKAPGKNETDPEYTLWNELSELLSDTNADPAKKSTSKKKKKDELSYQEMFLQSDDLVEDVLDIDLDDDLEEEKTKKKKPVKSDLTPGMTVRETVSKSKDNGYDWESITVSIPRNVDRTMQWNVPYPRNKDFLGRKDVLAKLTKEAPHYYPDSLGESVIHLLTGLPGAGKTQIVVEYLYDQAKFYDFVWWLRAGSDVTLLEDFASLYKRLELDDDKIEENADVMVSRIINWLNNHPNWLLVIDDIRNLDLVSHLLPKRAGHVIITSRYHENHDFRQFHIDSFDEEDACKFLQKRIENIEKEELRDITAVFDGFPLALAYLLYFVHTRNIPLNDFVAEVLIGREVLFEEQFSLSHYDRPVITVLNDFFDQLEQVSREAYYLLSFLSFFSGARLPVEFVRDITDYYFETIESDKKTPKARDAVLQILLRFNVLSQTDDFYKLNGILYFLLQARLSPARRLILLKHSLYVLDRFVTEAVDQVAQWPLLSELFPFMEVVLKRVNSEDKEVLVFLGHLLNESALFLKEQADFERALVFFDKALFYLKKTFDELHPSIAACLNNLGLIYEALENYDKAKYYLSRSLSLKKELFGNEAYEVAVTLNNLGTFNEKIGEMDKARHYLEEALEIKEAVLQKNDVSLAATLNNLGSVLLNLDQPEAAEHHLNWALQIYNEAYSDYHPDKAITLNNLGILNKNTGHPEKAETYLKQALEHYEHIFHFDHPSITDCLMNLVVLYRKSQNYTSLQDMYERLLGVYVQRYGRAHSSVALVHYQLGMVFFGNGDFLRAREQLSLAKEVLDQIDSEPSIYKARVLVGLGLALNKADETDEAMRFLQDGIEVYGELSEEWRPEVVMPLKHLAEVCQRTGQYEKAGHVLKKALSVIETYSAVISNPLKASVCELMGVNAQRQTLYHEAIQYTLKAFQIYKKMGAEKTMLLHLLNRMGMLFFSANDFDKAKYYFRQAGQLALQIHGANSIESAKILYNLAVIFKRQGKLDAAKKYLEKVMEIYESRYNKHIGLANCQQTLAEILIANGKKKRAEFLLKHALEIYSKELGERNSYTGLCRLELGRLYSLSDKYSLAKEELTKAVSVLSTSVGARHAKTIQARQLLKKLG